MKIRQGFVSNSSSSSFIVCYKSQNNDELIRQKKYMEVIELLDMYDLKDIQEYYDKKFNEFYTITAINVDWFEAEEIKYLLNDLGVDHRVIN